MSENDEPQITASQETLTWIDGVGFGLLATWRLTYVDPDSQAYRDSEVTARSVWLGPGGTLVFRAGDRQVFVEAHGPGAWDNLRRVEGSTVRAAHTLKQH